MTLDTVRIGWVLVHFVWQGTALAAMLAAALWMLRKERAEARYAVSGLTLFAMAVAPLVTWLALGETGGPVSLDLPPEARQAEWRTWSLAEKGASFEDWLPVLVNAWLCGFALLLARACGGWWLARRQSRQGAVTAPEWVSRLAERVAERLKPGLRFELKISLKDLGPYVFGYWKPVVLLPASALTGLTAAQLEMVLAHELAHILRRDYLVNLLQTITEAALFYHPGVWWVSAQIRRERENCCDDLAVSLCGDSVGYSRTLLALETARPQLALGATAGRLQDRIARLLGAAQEERNNYAPMLLITVLTGAGLLMAAPPPPNPPAPPEPPAAVSAPLLEQAPPPPPPAPPAQRSTPKQPPPPPPPAVSDSHKTYQDLTPQERQRVKAELARARAEIEASRVHIEREVKEAMQEARREIEREKPKIEAELAEAIRELKNVKSEQLSAEIKASIEAALASVNKLALEKIIAESALTASKAAMVASAEALKAVEAQLRDLDMKVQAERPGADSRERRIKYADDKWKQGTTRGSETPRGKFYVENGPPDEIQIKDGQETWRYKDRDLHVVREVEFKDGKLVKDERRQ